MHMRAPHTNQMRKVLREALQNDGRHYAAHAAAIKRQYFVLTRVRRCKLFKRHTAGQRRVSGQRGARRSRALAQRGVVVCRAARPVARSLAYRHTSVHWRLQKAINQQRDEKPFFFCCCFFLAEISPVRATQASKAHIHTQTHTQAHTYRGWSLNEQQPAPFQPHQIVLHEEKHCGSRKAKHAETHHSFGSGDQICKPHTS